MTIWIKFASWEDSTLDPWFTRPVLCHWAKEADIIPVIQSKVYLSRPPYNSSQEEGAVDSITTNMVTHKLLRSPSQAKKVPHKPKSASQAIKVPHKPIKCPQATKVLHRLIKCLTSCRGVRHRPIKCHTSCRGVRHKPIECLTSCRLCMVSFEPRWSSLIFFMKNYKKLIQYIHTIHSIHPKNAYYF